jgi:hypothetical protein
MCIARESSGPNLIIWVVIVGEEGGALGAVCHSLGAQAISAIANLGRILRSNDNEQEEGKKAADVREICWSKYHISQVDACLSDDCSTVSPQFSCCIALLLTFRRPT